MFHNIWNIVRENWKVLFFVLLVVLALSAFLFHTLFGGFSGDEHDPDNAVFAGVFLLIWAAVGLVSLCFIKNFLIVSLGSLIGAVITQCLINFFKHRHYPRKLPGSR